VWTAGLCLNNLGNFALQYSANLYAAVVTCSVSFMRCDFMVAAIKQAIGDPFLKGKAMTVRNVRDFDFDGSHAVSPVYFPSLGPHPWL